MTFAQFKLLALLLMMLGSAGAGGLAGWKLGSVRYEHYKVAVVAEHARAVEMAVAEQKRLDGISLAAAKREATAQAAVGADTRRVLGTVQAHVKELAHCIPLGFVRVLDAAAHGQNPDALILPAGKSDDACSAFRWADLARSIVANYGTARANGEQLDALIAALRQGKPR